MTTFAAYDRYMRSVRSAYTFLGLAHAVDGQSFSFPPYSDLEGRPKNEVFAIVVAALGMRVRHLDEALAAQLLERPFLRYVSFLGKDLFIPIVNKEGEEWYATSSIHNFDFVVESFIGMHSGARIIYDFGSHQGVWSLYYALSAGETGRIYSIEPSILNVECALLSFLINEIGNVITIPAGIGSSNATIGPAQDGLLVSGVSHMIRLLKADEIMWEPADFVKIDIEGFEWDMLRSFPLFHHCRNVHLELHIPHLERRGLDYREIVRLIPFDLVQVRNYKGLRLTEVGPDDTLEGYCSLLITPRP